MGTPLLIYVCHFTGKLWKIVENGILKMLEGFFVCMVQTDLRTHFQGKQDQQPAIDLSFARS